MAIFGPKPCVNPLGKMSIFLTFWTSCFCSLERRFFVLEYDKRHFPALYCLKKKSWKNGQEKCQFFDFLDFLFLQPSKAFFRSRISQKTFSWPILPKKKEVGKMAIFGPKPWVNPLGKMSIFRLFGLLVFIDQKGVFWFQNIIKDIFLSYIA